jgi:hypothetical protein
MTAAAHCAGVLVGISLGKSELLAQWVAGDAIFPEMKPIPQNEYWTGQDDGSTPFLLWPTSDLVRLPELLDRFHLFASSGHLCRAAT